MRKRLRKKRRVREFAQYGCRLVASCREETAPEQIEDLRDRWLSDVCDIRGLEHCCVAWQNQVFEVLVCRRHGTVTEEEVTEFAEWIAVQPGVVRVKVGDLVDLWHTNLFDEAERIVRPRNGPLVWMITPAADVSPTLEMVKTWLAGSIIHFGLPGEDD